MLPDYYAMLGVPTTADLPTIKKAYRQKAMECHPDRHPGGDHNHWHQAMQQINEAFEILSNPEKRQRHDAAMAQQYDMAAQHSAAKDTATARQHSDDYPQQWDEFESWLDKLTRDFTEAEYYRSSGGNLRVDKSYSGYLFMAIGCVGGIGLYCILVLSHIMWGSGGLIWVFGGAGIGVGAWLHKQLGHSFCGPTSEPPPSTEFQSSANQADPQHVLVDCPNCHGRLRLPAKNVKARCPRCQHVFEHNPGDPERQSPVAASPPCAANKAAHDKGVGLAVIVGIVAFIILCCVCRDTVGGGLFSDPESCINWPGVFIGTCIAAFIAYLIGKKS